MLPENQVSRFEGDVSNIIGINSKLIGIVHGDGHADIGEAINGTAMPEFKVAFDPRSAGGPRR